LGTDVYGPNLAKFSQPTVCDVDFPAVEVRQAVYSEVAGALIVAIGPNGSANSQKEQITFRVKNLSAERARKVIEDDNVSRNFDEVNPTETS